jgi:hypothetical protein
VEVSQQFCELLDNQNDHSDSLSCCEEVENGVGRCWKMETVRMRWLEIGMKDVDASEY